MELRSLDLIQKAKTLPQSPGVYIMKDKINNIIYIGKSKSLRNRVISYFQNNKNHTPKIKELVGNIHSLDYIETDTELEALLLESKLIKEKKPMYNRLLKNPKRYIFIKITLEEKFPKIIMTYETKDDGGLYFGPFTSLGSIEQSILFVKENFPIIQCSNPSIGSKRNVCLNYHLGKCKGICDGLFSQDKYMDYIGDIIALLNGEKSDLVAQAEIRMNEAARKLDFKLAARYRDQISGIKHVLRVQKVITDSKKGSKIIALEAINEGKLKVFFVKGNFLVNAEVIECKTLQNEELVTKLRKLVFKNFNKIDNNEYIDISRKNIDEALIISSYLKSKKENFHYIDLKDNFINEDVSDVLKEKLRF